MSTLSRTAEKCRKCPNVKNCNNKRLEACELPRQASASLMAPLTGLSDLSMSNPITPITIKMGEYGDIHTSLEEINKKIMQAFRVDACYFK